MTSTTMPGVCGDGIINQVSEQCDGAALGECAGTGLFCGQTGGPAACQCCLAPGATFVCGFCFSLPCCDGGSAQQIGPHALVCANTSGRCDPPAVCPLGTCQADHSCCAAQGNACLQFYPAPINFGASVTCCAGSVCRALQSVGPGVEIDCCLPDGGTCAADADCCTGHCTGGACDQCRAPGAACANDNECCTPSCVSGACGPCYTAGTPCTDGVQCCSGTCNLGPAGLGTCQ